jgi:HAMP domain-containing protein
MPARPGRRGLRTRLLLWLMASATLVLGLTGIIDWSFESARVRGERDRATQATLDRLALVLPSAIEDLDTQAVRNAVASELTNPHVAALTVTVGGKRLASEERRGASSSGDELHRVLPRPGEDGEIILRIDPEPLAQAQAAVVTQTVVGLVAINLLIALAVSIVVSSLLRPISALTSAAETIAAGKFDAPLPHSGDDDEVAVLEQAFVTMRDAIRRQLADIAEQNRVLDERVRERTGELERLHQDLLAAAHQAGRAEIATSVLHNIGNVLTGAFVDLEGLRREAGNHLPKQARQLSELLKGERDLARFINEDRRGRPPALPAIVPRRAAGLRGT